MSKERKKYELRATKKPAKNDVLSTAVVVRNEAGEVGYCYISFSQAFVDAVGTALPRGLCAADPGCIRVSYYVPTQVWLIQACYIDGSCPTLLWKTSEKPSWLNFYKVRKSHGSDPQKDGEHTRHPNRSNQASNGTGKTPSPDSCG